MGQSGMLLYKILSRKNPLVSEKQNNKNFNNLLSNYLFFVNICLLHVPNIIYSTYIAIVIYCCELETFCFKKGEFLISFFAFV